MAITAIVFLLFIQSCRVNKRAKTFNQEIQLDNIGLNFVNGALEGDLTEIKASQLAKSHSQNPRVIRFAQMMIVDHTNADAKLKKIARDNLVSGEDVVSVTHSKMISKLSTKSGADFDKSYMAMMVNDHENAVKLFEGATGAENGTVQNFVKKTLPIIQMHLDSAKAIDKALK
jgi:putative membrane protein